MSFKRHTHPAHHAHHDSQYRTFKKQTFSVDSPAPNRQESAGNVVPMADLHRFLQTAANDPNAADATSTYSPPQKMHTQANDEDANDEDILPFTDDDGETYYFNRKTRKTSYDRTECKSSSSNNRKTNSKKGSKESTSFIRWDWDGPLGVSLCQLASSDETVVVGAVPPQSPASGKVEVGSVLQVVDGVGVQGKTYLEVMAMLKSAKRPCVLGFGGSAKTTTTSSKQSNSSKKKQ